MNKKLHYPHKTQISWRNPNKKLMQEIKKTHSHVSRYRFSSNILRHIIAFILQYLLRCFLASWQQNCMQDISKSISGKINIKRIFWLSNTIFNSHQNNPSKILKSRIQDHRLCQKAIKNYNKTAYIIMNLFSTNQSECSKYQNYRQNKK